MSSSTQNDSIQVLGLELVRTLHLALRTVQTHGFDNDLSVEVVQRFVDTINSMVEEQREFSLFVIDDYVFIGSARLRQTGTNFRFLAHFTEEMNRRGVGSFSGDRSVGADEGREFLRVFLEFSEGGEGACAQIQTQLASIGSPLSVGPTRGVHPLGSADSQVVTRREKCKRAFFQAVAVGENVMRNAFLGEALQLTQAKRTVQRMVDLVMDEEFTLIGLTTLQSHDNYTFYHSANVCIYAVSLGKRLGLSPPQLADLGAGALLHDIGKAKIPLEILQKTGSLTEEERNVMDRHPVYGARDLIRSGGFSPLVLKGMIGCFEHHMCFNGPNLGYPKTKNPYHPHVFGRLISIVDCFDALTTRRVYRDHALRRDRALALMLRDANVKFDPTLIRMFTNMLGVYPIGTTVQL